jgi:SNF family Na+-dependent transporter
MSMRRDLSLLRVLLIYVLGVLAGVQCALYLFDTFDDGVSEPLSGAIGLLFLLLGVALIARTFRRPAGAVAARP